MSSGFLDSTISNRRSHLVLHSLGRRAIELFRPTVDHELGMLRTVLRRSVLFCATNANASVCQPASEPADLLVSYGKASASLTSDSFG